MVLGPINWCIKYPCSVGKAQSPIDIQDKNAIYDENLAQNPLKICYEVGNFSSIENTGASFKITGDQFANSCIFKLNFCFFLIFNLGVIGGPVKDEHKFLQFHMHWGKDASSGSEHLINGKPFAGEIHFVNWNSKKFSKDSDAVCSSDHDGLVVLGILVNIGEHNLEFDKILDCLHEIPLRNKVSSLKQSLDIEKLFPGIEDKNF